MTGFCGFSSKFMAYLSLLPNQRSQLTSAFAYVNFCWIVVICNKKSLN